MAIIKAILPTTDSMQSISDVKPAVTIENRADVGRALKAETPGNGKPKAPKKRVAKAKKSAKPEQKKAKKMKAKKYEKYLRKLQVELCRLQDWVKYKGLRVIVVFEGRDGAGKGGTIRAITERVSPRVFRLVALPAPSDREKSQMYIQRYMAHFPAAGEVVIFDRSWYNRAGVEYVMGFCTKEQHSDFLDVCPQFEKYIVDGGIILIKFWLEVSDKEQSRRFEARITDPVRQWKLSPMDLPSRTKWFEYSRARDMMLKATDTKWAPWRVVRSDDKKRARLNCISHLLDVIPYKKAPREKVKLPKRSMKGSYDDQASLRGRTFVPELY
jgi:polyphosphate kinase 2